MSLIKLKTRQSWENRYLKSKQELISKPYSSTGVASKAASWIFKIIVLGFFALLIIFPFYFMLTQSLTDKLWQTRQTTTILFPIPFTEGGKWFHWDNYRAALEQGYLQSLVFTLGITFFSILIRLFFSITLGYALSLKNWKGKGAFFAFFLSLLILPEVALLTGQYTVIVRMGWHSGALTIIALVIPFAASIFFSYMYKNAFEAIPNSVKESSMLDGAGGFRYFFNIALPMVKSTTWTVAILTAFASWNSYTWPALILAGSNSLWQPMNLWVFTTGKDPDADLQILYTSIRMAATVLAILPMLIIYFIFRRRIMDAISRNGNATKG
ncbi:carbohydrate ABC transporter permease [Mycoplasma phocoeninasale]|uniref:Carbohydrate ABC transporter permease n=1 Tax=Mycoplasma phocoeninasale TaxID=2726117 RepID=A0A858U4A6_9MOLU|nr:carbohydrate ABC transporter permease [Mycoplasma phocoeninasale]QJG66237.1 carbohydrate ABC transporter permease [Mycoplasma phocoeninasale]